MPGYSNFCSVFCGKGIFFEKVKRIRLKICIFKSTMYFFGGGLQKKA